MKIFSLAQKIAEDTRCAQGGAADRAAHILVYLADFRDEIRAEDRKRMTASILWFSNVDKFSAAQVLVRTMAELESGEEK